LSSDERAELLKTLKTRFEKNMNRHKDIEWAKVQAKLESNPGKLWSLNEMEISGGEPDVVDPIAIGKDNKLRMGMFFHCLIELLQYKSATPARTYRSVRAGNGRLIVAQ